jgi:hypothetical protein
MDIQEKVEKARYSATEHEVEQLAAAHFSASDVAKRIDNAYLRILINALQAKFPITDRKRRLSADERQRHAAFITETHSRFYAAVLRGVTTPDVADDATLTADERRARAGIRNGRAGYARTAASTIQVFIKAGGDVRTLDVMTVTKTALRAFAVEHAERRPVMEVIMTTLHRVELQVSGLIEEDPDQARAAVEECMARLQRILDELPHDGEGKAAPAEAHRIRRHAA